MLGSTPAMMENEIASGIRARATTRPDKISVRATEGFSHSGRPGRRRAARDEDGRAGTDELDNRRPSTGSGPSRGAAGGVPPTGTGGCREEAAGRRPQGQDRGAQIEEGGGPGDDDIGGAAADRSRRAAGGDDQRHARVDVPSVTGAALGPAPVRVVGRRAELRYIRSVPERPSVARPSATLP
ncbi:hypothetical protein GCM10017600_59970 [Streptosporangium carneum]|uniref:Uncharacterized protein n=1 Tax=Streptosporangium carneum TaxID=47481 RepID=A0A9W6I5Q5_9ACTN|nr:hypothetical protein GCM10017600_59970 [Streptosporangium carneum]